MQTFLYETLRAAGLTAQSMFLSKLSIKTKSDIGDLLTDADQRVNDYIISAIVKRFPHDHIHSEESEDDINPGAAREWVIDPIDGTRNFAAGIAGWCHMIAILEAGELTHAAVYEPLADIFFYAKKGGGAFRNGQKLAVNDIQNLRRALGILVCDSSGEHVHRFNIATKSFLDLGGWLQNTGSMFASCCVASGGVDFSANNCGYDHDYLPAALICREAGALVTDIDGQPWQRGRRDIVIANPLLYPHIMRLFQLDSAI